MPYNEPRLEELSFIKLFPYGRNGYRELRDNIIKPAAYAKARLMGVDSRFQLPEYLFYVQNMIEQDQISRNVSVCARRLKKNNERINSLHVYTKGLRGEYN